MLSVERVVNFFGLVGLILLTNPLSLKDSKVTWVGLIFDRLWSAILSISVIKLLTLTVVITLYRWGVAATVFTGHIAHSYFSTIVLKTRITLKWFIITLPLFPFAFYRILIKSRSRWSNIFRNLYSSFLGVSFADVISCR